MFRSFFLAGFEGFTGYTRDWEWFDQIVATGHDCTIDSDYAELARLGIHGVRECVRWPLIDLGRGQYDFSSLDPFLRAANRHRMDVIWDLFHFGYPRDLDPLSREFRLRFADYCFEAGRYIADHSRSEICWFTPINEPSFLALAGGDKGLFAPHPTGRGWDLKVALCRAAIAGIEALWVAAPECRIVNVDPLCRVVAGRPELEEQARKFNETWVFQAWDVLAGRLLPELGGSVRHLDVVGVHYDWTHQWELEAEPLADGTIAPLAADDPRRLPAADLVRSVWQRYGHELIVSETAHAGEQRSRWLREVAAEAESLLDDGVPLGGICLFPGRLAFEEMLEALGEVRSLNALLSERSRQVERARPRPGRISELVRGGGRY